MINCKENKIYQAQYKTIGLFLTNGLELSSNGVTIWEVKGEQFVIHGARGDRGGRGRGRQIHIECKIYGA